MPLITNKKCIYQGSFVWSFSSHNKYLSLLVLRKESLFTMMMWEWVYSSIHIQTAMFMRGLIQHMLPTKLFSR